MKTRLVTLAMVAAVAGTFTSPIGARTTKPATPAAAAPAPATGPPAVLGEGTLVFSVSPGSKPTKIASVKLEKGKSFNLGAATVTLSEVTPGESASIELALPRSVLYTIRDVKFLDAAGAPLE